MRKLFHIVVCVSCISVGGLTGLDSAVASDIAQSKRPEAKRLFRAGAAAYAAGQYLAAAQALEQSYELIPMPATAFSLAQAYRLQFFIDQDSRHLERAIALYRVYIDAVASGQRRGDAVASLAELEPIKLRMDEERKQRSAIAPTTIEPYEPPTQIMVVSSAPGVKISIDGGESSSQVPVVAVVEPGLHIAKVQADGYKTVTKQITAVEGRLVVVEVDLKEEPAEVWFRGVPGAQVWLDGRVVAQLPLQSPVAITAGKHRIYVTKKGRVPWARYVTVERGGTLDVKVELPITVQRQISYGFMGVGTLGLVGAGVIGLLALQEEQEAVRLSDQRTTSYLTRSEAERYATLVEDRDAHATAAWLSFGISMAVTAAGSLLYHFEPSRAMSTSGDTWLSVVPTHQGLGFGLSGRF